MERLTKKTASIHASTSKIISEVDAELSKEAADTDLLEEFLEELFLKEECLDKIDEEIEEQTKAGDLEDEATRAMEYEEHITLRKTKIRRALRRQRGDVSSVMSGDIDSVCYNVKLPKLVIDIYTGDISHWQYFWGTI